MVICTKIHVILGMEKLEFGQHFLYYIIFSANYIFNSSFNRNI